MRWPRLKAPSQIIAALALLLAVITASLWAQHDATVAAQERQHTLDVRIELVSLKTDVAEMSLGAGGFALSGHEAWRKRYGAASASATQRLQRLRTLMANSASQQQRLQRLAPLLASLMQFHEATLDIATHRGLDAARERLTSISSSGRSLAVAAGALVDTLDAEEQRLLKIREAAADEKAAIVTAITLLGSLPALALVGWAGLALQRSVTQLRRTSEAAQAQALHLAELNEALWQSVTHDADAPATAAPSSSALARIDDPARLAALQRTGLMDSPAEPDFDRFTRLAAQTLQVPVSLISLVDDHREFFKSAVGLSEPWATRRETPLSHSFCQHVVASSQPLVVDEARLNPLVRDNGAVCDLGVAAYLGVPLTTPDGHVLGSLCAIDSQPRAWSDEDRAMLERIAQSVLAAIAVRMQLQELERQVQQRTAEARESEQWLRLAQEAGRIGTFDADLRTGVTVWTPRMEAIYGLPPGGLAARGGDWEPLVHRDDRAALDELLQHAQVTGEPVEGQWRVVWPDASVHWVLGRFQVTFDAAGQPARVSGVNIDITERHLAEEAMKASLAEKEVLLQEIHHRVKNNLQTVSSLLQLQQREVQEPALRAVFAEADSRVRAMALVHEQLYQRELLSELDFGHYLRCLVEQLLHSGAADLSLSLDLELQPLRLPVDAAIPLALITSELLTNALKYAYRDRGGGMLRIVLKSAGPAQLVLEVADDGPGLPEGFDPMAAHSLGLRLVQMLALQLDAEVQFARASGESGASCRITAPLAWTMAAHAAQVPA